MSPSEAVTLLVWALGSGALVGWWTAMLWRRGSAPAPAAGPEIVAVMRLDIRGHQVTAYLDEAALRDVAALAGYALVAPTVQTPSRRAH